MGQPEGTVWDRDPHTAAKHDMLRLYLAAWFPILLRGGFRSVTYAEGFAGPGAYAGGEDGSPIIALRQVVGRPELIALGKPIRFILVEERQDRLGHLRALVNRVSPRESRPANLILRGKQGRCQTTLVPELEKAGAFGQPIFGNLDAWGADVPYELVARIASSPASEVLVTFVSDFFRRFATLEDIGKGDVQFGNSNWRRVAELAPVEKKRFLVDQYTAALNRAGLPMTLTFELLDEGGRSLFLVFGTKGERGLERMKDAMWKVDPVYGLRFRDPRDVNQLEFTIDQPDLTPLREELKRALSDGERHVVEDLRRHTLVKTVYRPPHATQVLRELRDTGPLQSDGGRLQKDSVVWLA